MIASINLSGKHWFYNNEKNLLFVNLPKTLRNKLWAEEFGDLYHFIINNTPSKITINAENVIWLDPIPVLSLLVLFNQFTSINKDDFKISLPNIKKKNNLNLIENKSNVLLKFLCEEGFLDKLNELAIINNNNDSGSFELFKKEIESLPIDLNYFDCHLVKTRIIDANKIHEDTDDEIFYSEINDLIEEIRVNLINKKIPQSNFENILYKIRLFFSETINNVFQHAYPNSEKKYFGIYIRYRYGLQNDSIDNYREKLRDLLDLEKRNSTCLFNECTDTIFSLREGCVELFIVDSGIGIAASSGYRKTEKHPTRKAYQDILNSSPLRYNQASGTKNQTKNGGLYVIGKHIEETNDFILIKDYEDWLAGILPETGHNESFERISSLTGIHTPGCIIQVTFSWFVSKKRDPNNWIRVSDNSILESLFSVYKTKQGNAEILKPFVFIDERLINYPNIVSKKEYIYSKLKEGANQNSIIYLPHKGMTKHLLAFKILPHIAKNLSKNTSIIIADIPDEERLIYYEALCYTTYNNSSLKPLLGNINQIILISNSLSICAFEIFENKIQHSQDIQNDFCELRVFGLSLIMILEVLVTYDSFLIWNNVKSTKNRDIFINGKILWAKDEYLDEFLVFNRLSTLPAFCSLFLYGITRVLGLLSSKHTKFIGIDALVDNLISKLSTKEAVTEEKIFNVYLGSVYVKGITQNETIYNKQDSIVVHCFQHPSLYKTSVLKLFFWPKKEWINSNFKKIDPAIKYERIGRTPAIAIDGWQYFQVPRYLPDGKSFYFLSPKESYLKWQNPQIGLRLGHFKYGKHFDLIKPNIKAIVEKTFLEKGDLARFLVSNFYYATGGDNPSTQILDPDYREIIDKYNFRNFYQSNSSIVFPNHPSNSFIVEKICEILSPVLVERIIPLNYIRNDNYRTNHLFSPLNFDRIKSYITDEKSEIVFFDDAVVSGRTRKEVKHLLLSFGVKEVKTLAIFDRQRLPYIVPNPKTNIFYARLDIPRLGNGNNIFLDALSKAISTEHLVASARERILEWKKRWDVNCDTQYNSNILYPIGINPYKKKFATKRVGERYFQIGGEENKILLTNSIGLTTYCLELFCTTGRDDIILKYCKLIDNERVRIELICCNLLLYSQELKNSLKTELLIELLKASNYKTPDSYTSLSALTILTLDQETIKKISTEDYAINNCNMDIQIAFAIATSDSNQITDSYNNYISNVKEQNNQGLLNITDFHRQIFEKRKSHISPLHAIINGNRPLEIRMSTLRTALEKLIWHCDYMLPTYGINTTDLKNNVIDCKKKTDRYINGDSDDYIEISNIVKDNILPPVEDAHSNLFFEITTKEHTIEDLINELICDKFEFGFSSDDGVEQNPEFMISNSGQKVLKELHQNDKLPLWIPLTENIKIFIKDLIYNSVHGSFLKIADPFSDLKLPRTHVWYSFSYFEVERKFHIQFANGIFTKKSFDKAVKTKHRKKLYDYQLDIDFQYEFKEVEDYMILITKLIFPVI